MMGSATRRLFGRLRRRWPLPLAVAAAAVLLGFGALHLLIHSDWFRDQVRARLIAELETATGGEVSLGSFEFDPANLSVSLRLLQIRAAHEPAVPFLTVPYARLELGIESLVRRKVFLRSLRLLGPEVRVEMGDGGVSNLPARGQRSAAVAAESLLGLGAGSLEVREGRFVWNRQVYELSFGGRDFDLEARYEAEHERYAGAFRLGPADVELDQRRQFLERASAEFFVYAERIEVPQLSAVSPSTSFEGSLTVIRLEAPHVYGEYRVLAQLGPWAQWWGGLPVRAGLAEAAGTAAWDSLEGALFYEGQASVTDAAYQAAGVPVENISGRMDYEGDLQSLSLTALRVSLLDGAFEGRANVTLPFQGRPLRFRAEGDLAGLSLESASGLLAATAGRELPWDAAAGGRLEVEGGRGDFQAKVALELQGRGGGAPGLIPVNGTVEASYPDDAGAWRIARLELSTPHSELSGAGRLRTGAGSLFLSLDADLFSLRDVEELCDLFQLDTAAFPDLNSPARFAGTVLFPRLGAPELYYQLDGSFAAGPFRLLGQNWMSFAGDISATDEELAVRNGRLRATEGTVDLDVRLPLEGHEVAWQRPLEAVLRVSGLPASRFLQAARLDWPLEGNVEGEANLTGRISRLQGRAGLSVTQGALLGEPFERLTASLQLEGDRYQVESAKLVLPEAGVDATGAFEPATRRFRFDLSGAGWRFEDLETFQNAHWKPSGRLEFDLTAAGRLSAAPKPIEDLDVSGAWAVEELQIREQQIGGLTGNVQAAGDQVALEWTANVLNGTARGTAKVSPSADGPYEGELQFKQVAAQELSRLAGVPLQSGIGTLSGEAAFRGRLADLETIEAEGQITDLQLDLSPLAGAESEYRVWNPFPLRWSFAESVLRLDHMKLTGEETDFEIDGVIPFTPGKKIEASIDGSVGLKALAALQPGIQASGTTAMEVQLGGSLEKPSVRGRMRISNGSLRAEDVPNAFTDVSGRLTFNGEQLRVDEITASTGGGKLRLGGSVEFGETPVTYRLRAEADSVRVRYPPSMSNRFDGALTFSGAGNRSLVSGEIVINRSKIAQDFDLGAALAALSQPTQTPESNPWLLNMQFNVHVNSLPELRIEYAQIRNMETDIDLRLTGTAANPSVLGRMSITQGTINFRGSRFTINRGDIDFVNPFRLEPVLNLELETRVRDVDVALTLSGPASKVNVSYRSDPPLEFNELVNLIAVGRTPVLDPVFASDQMLQQQALIRSGPSNIFSQALTQRQSPGLQRFFGVSRLKVDPQVGGVESNPSARISTDQQITSDLTLTYSYDLSSSQQQVVRVEWAPERRWSFIVTRDENGLVGGDVLYKVRLR